MFIINFPLPFFIHQIDAGLRQLTVLRPFIFQPFGILRRQTVPFGLLARVFRSPICKNFLFVILIPLGVCQDLLLRHQHPRFHWMHVSVLVKVCQIFPGFRLGRHVVRAVFIAGID